MCRELVWVYYDGVVLVLMLCIIVLMMWLVLCRMLMILVELCMSVL